MEPENLAGKLENLPWSQRILFENRRIYHGTGELSFKTGKFTMEPENLDWKQENFP